MKKIFLFICFLVPFTVVRTNAQGVFTSNSAGPAAWSSAGSWTLSSGSDADGVPDADDDVSVASGHTITITVDQACNALTVDGTINWTVATRTLTVNGTLTTNTCTLQSTISALGNLAVNGNWVVGSSAVTTIGNASNAVNILMTANLLTLNGELKFNKLGGAGGVQAFNNVTIASGGVWNSAVAQNFSISGDLINSSNSSSAFKLTSAANRTFTFTGTGKQLAGNSLLDFRKYSVIFDGTYTNNNTNAVSGVMISNISGAGSFSQGTNSYLILSTTGNDDTGDFLDDFNFNASATGNTVTYTFAIDADNTIPQVIKKPKDGAYYNLQLFANKALLPDTTNINNRFIIAAKDTVTSLTANFVINLKGNWEHGSGIGHFIAQSGTVNFNGTSTQLIQYTVGDAFYNLICNGAGTKQLISAAIVSNNLTILSGSTLDVKASSNYALSVGGNFTNNGTFLPQIGKVTFNGTAAQTIGGTTNTQFYDIDITNTTLGGVALASDQSILHNLTLSSNSKFITTGYHYTLISTNTTLTGRIAQIPSGASITGPIVMQRYLPATLLTDWRYIGAPVTATVAEWVGDFPTSGFTDAQYDPTNTFNFCSVQTYNETVTTGTLDDGFTNIAAASEAITPGKGFAAYVGNTQSGQTFSLPITISAEGAPGVGDITVALTSTPTSTSVNDGWNLIANPYPSDIDWDAAGGIDKAATGVSAMYIYNPAIATYYVYAGGTSTPDAPGTLDQYIPSSAAFWVKATSSGSFVFHESAKVDISRAHYSPQPSAKDESVVLRITVTGEGAKDETVIKSKNDATPGFDNGYDAYKMPSAKLAISTPINYNDDLVINTIPLTGNLTIPVRVKVPKTGTYVIAKGSNSTWHLSSCTILEDLLTGIKTDLNTSSYSFTISDTTKAPRFVIHLGGAVTKSAIAATCQGKSDGKAIAKGIGAGPFTYVWKNSKGEVLRTTTNVTTADELSNLPAGIYTVEIKNGSPLCGDVTDKIEIAEPEQLTSAFDITSIDCKGGNTGAITANVTGGTKPYTYKWSNGATTATVADLAKGEYTVTITDANNCQSVASATVKSVNVVTAAFTPSASIIYLVEDNGKASFKNETKGSGATYIWDFGDNSDFSTAAEPIHYYGDVGIYNVQLNAQTTDCSNAVSKQIEVKFNKTSTVTEIDADKTISIGIAGAEQAFVKFDYSETSSASITIQNILGQRLGNTLKVIPNNQTVYLDLSTINNNVLLITVTTANGTVTKKIIRNL